MTAKYRKILAAGFSVTLFVVLWTNWLGVAESAQGELRDVWERVRQSGAYAYSAAVTQVNTPQATVVNAGRESKSSRLYMEGETDLNAEVLHLALWNGGGSVLSPESGVEIKVEGQTAMARQGAGAWEEIDDFTGLFAPGGDFLAYTKAAENVVRHAPETRSTAVGEINFTRYTFDINGRRFAEQMRGPLMDRAVREGLPPGMQMELPRVYVGMTGTGELWIGADGLPLRQQFTLTFPETKDNYVTTAEISVDFRNFAPLPPAALASRVGRTISGALQAALDPHIYVPLPAIALFLFCVFALIKYGRSRHVYRIAAVIIVITMVTGPFLTSNQVYAYGTQQLAKQKEQEARQEEYDGQQDLQDQLDNPSFDPHRDPLELARQKAALAGPEQTIIAEGDNERYYDDRCESDPDGDIDNDMLTNLEECLLGTLIDDADSDDDGASDYHEVTGVNLNGVMWYTDPVLLDSNNDGLGDGKEWFTDPDDNGSPVLDTDGDGRPDIWDEDNDGDGVMDRLDLSPYMSTGPDSAAPKSFNEQSPLDLTMNNLVKDELVKVEFQIRPDNPDHLWYSQNILDWPYGDRTGNIQDADGKTFYDIDNTTSPSPNDNGDVRMVPLLEITFNNADANLPPSETCQDDDGNDYTCYPILEDFSISVSRVDDNTSVAYVPLQLVQDATGDANVAFYGRMLYQASGSWGTPHQVRMAWAIQALVDVCSAYENGYCTAYETYNDIQLIHIYYDDFHLTGLHMTEDHSANMALVYEDPVQTTGLANQDKPFYLDVLNGLLYGLDKSFLAGRCTPTESDGSCAPNATRDMTVDEIYRRFNHATNSGVSDTERWNLPNVLTVVKNEYESVDLGMLDLTTVQTGKILDDHFTSAWSASSPISPTIMVTFEQVYRDLNLDQEIAAGQTHVNWQGNKLTLDMPQSGANAVETDTMASVKWTPYDYDPASGWAAADIQQFWLALEKEWGPIYEGSPDPDTYQTYGQYLYLAIYNGSNQIVQTGDIIYPADFQQLDPTVAETLTIQGLSYTFAALQSLMNASADNAEELAQLAQFLQEIGFPDSKIPQKAAQKALVFYSELGETSYVMVVTFMAVVAIVVAVSLILYLTIHNTGVNWTLAISVGLLMLVYTVIKPVLEYVQFVRSVMATSETIGFGEALIKAISELNTMTEGAKFFATMGLILEVGVAVGFFIQAWANGSAKPGSIAFNEAVAITIATIYVAVLLFVIGSFLLGGLLIGIISLIDSVLKLAGVNWSITGALTKALASVIYQYNIYTKQDTQTGTLANELVDPTAGLTAGNHFSFTLPITTTLTRASGLVPYHLPDIKNDSLIYQLGAQGVALSTSRNAREKDWTVSNNNTKAAVTDFPSTQVELQAGINSQVPLYLNTGYALGAQSCWVGICSDKTISGSSIAFLGSEMVFDIFPQTLQEFLDLSANGWAAGRLRAVDRDGDGLLAAAYGGLDPDDANWDSDGDGLSDGYELTIRAKAPTEGGLNLNPLNPDGDADFITDGDELLYGTNPDNEDSDGDGILDIEEVPYIVDVNGKVNIGGWDLPYGPQKTTRTWGDPLTDDADGDGLSDLFERSQDTCPTCTPWTDPNNPAVYSPNVWNQSPVNLFIADGSSDGFVAPGETINYTTTTENNLGQGQELIGDLSLELPDSFMLTGGNLEQAVDITSGSSQSLESTIKAINTSTSISGTLISTMRLSNFETTAWSWDPPQPGSVTAAASIQDLVAVPVFGWEEPSLLIAREVAGDGTQSLVGYLADPNSLAGDPQPLYTASSGETLTAPAVACKDDGTCVVIFGINSSSAPGIVRSMTLYKGLSEKPPNQFIWAAGDTATLDIQSTAVAGDETGFLAGWTAADGNAYVQYVDNVGLPGEENTQQLASSAADVTLSAASSGYLAGWTQGGNLMRADITVSAPTVNINKKQTVDAGSGWPQGAAPRQVYDPTSRQALLLYRDANARLQARRLTTGISDPLEIDQNAGDDLSGNGVQTALCADIKNGGWVAAWSSPNDNLTYYQAVGPDGTLRGEPVQQSGSGVPLALTCNAPRPAVDLEFEDPAGSTQFIDSSGFGNHAICDGAACPEAAVSGRFGRAVRFNGTSQALQIPNSESFNFAANHDFTVSVWVVAAADQNTKTNDDNDIIEKWSAGSSYPFAIRFNNKTGQVIAERWDGQHNPNISSQQRIDDGEFHHIAFVKDSGYLYLYIDGEQSGSRVADTTTGDTTNSSDLTIGMRGDKTNHFTGIVDELQIYERALTAQEIGGVFESAAAMYDLDEVAGSQIIVDASGNLLNGTCSGASCPTLGVPGVAYSAARFDGQDDYFEIAPQKAVVKTYNYDFEYGVGPEWNYESPGDIDFNFDEPAGSTQFLNSSSPTGTPDYAVCPSAANCPTAGGPGGSVEFVSGTNAYLNVESPLSPLFDGATKSFTLMARIKTTGHSMGIITYSNDNTGWESGEKSFYLDQNGYPTFNGFGNGYIRGNKAVNDGEWHQVVVTWQPFVQSTNGNGHIYVDGQDVTSGVDYVANHGGNASMALRIGRPGYFSEAANYFVGSVDRVQYFSWALPAWAVKAQYDGAGQPGRVKKPSDVAYSGGDYYLGDFFNDTATLKLSDLPQHDTVKIRFDFIAFVGSPTGWDGNSSYLGPDNWAWGYDQTSVLRTNFNNQEPYSNNLPTGQYQAYPAAASTSEGRPNSELTLCHTGNAGIGNPPCNRLGHVGSGGFFEDTPDLAATAADGGVGDNPGWASFQAPAGNNIVVQTFIDKDYGRPSVVFDANRSFVLPSSPMANPSWPGGISSLRIWKAAHDPWAGRVGGYSTGSRGSSGNVYTLEATIPNHTADEIELFFDGLTAADDIYGAERWGIDNVEVTVERDDTSIPLYDTSFTTSAWARRTVAGQEGYIFSQGQDGPANHVLHMGFRSNGRFTCAFLNDDLNSSPLPFDQEWHHYACTYDAQTRLRTIYRDGVQIAQDTAGANYQAQGSTIIGAYVDHTSNFAGDIDEVAFWRTALTAAEIGALYEKIKVEDQSVMTAILADAGGSNNSTLTYDNLVLRETATRLGAITQSIERVLTIDADNPVVCPPGQGTSDASCPPQDQYVNAQTLVVSGVAGDPTSYISLVEVKPGNSFVPAVGTESWSYGWNLSGLSDGEHTLPVRATDAVGHLSSLYNVKIILDRTAPVVTIDQPVNERRAQQDKQGNWFVPLSGTVNDPAAGGSPGSGVVSVEVLLRGEGNSGLGWQEAAVSGNTWSLDYILPQFDQSGHSVPSPSGAYPAVVRATDNLGNSTPGNNPALTLNLDEDGPEVTLTNPVSATQLISASLTLQGQVSDASAVSSVEVNFTPSEQVDALSGSVLSLPFDESQATQYFEDQSASGNAAVCSDPACPTPDANGQRGGAFNFDGTDDVLDTQSDVVELAKGDFSIAAWVKTTAVSQGIVTKNDGDKVWENGEKSFYIDDAGLPRFVGFGDGYIISTAKVNDGQWHHVLVTWDYTNGREGKIYVDGNDVTSTAASYNAANADNAGDTLKIAEPNFQGAGSDIEAPNHFQGSLDEVMVINRALAAYEAANLYAYGLGTWAAAAVSNGSWSYTLPQGENGIEGYYQINVRGTDAFGNVTSIGSQRVWRGEIDTRPPLLNFLATDDDSGSVPSTKFECLVTDFNLVQSQSCLPVSPATEPEFRTGDMTTTTYDQVDQWYATNIADNSRLYTIDATRTYSGQVDSNVALQACDLYNHCTTVQNKLLTAPTEPAGAEVLQPSSGTVLTTLDPVTVSGDAYAHEGLQALIVTANETSLYAQTWENGRATSSPWSFEWEPPGEGVYVFNTLISDWNNVPKMYWMLLPLIAAHTPGSAPGNGTAAVKSVTPGATTATAEQRTAAMDFLTAGIWPQAAQEMNDLYTGTPTTIYVDLEPPSVTIEPTVLAADHLLGEGIVALSGQVHDNLPLVRVDVRIDDGPWDRAGIEDGLWHYPWRLSSQTNGQTFAVTVRATDVAGRAVDVTEQVEVDIVPPTPGEVALTYTNSAGQQRPMEPGDRLSDAVSIEVTWGPGSGEDGAISYKVGFSQSSLIDPEDLTTYAGPGTHTQAVSAGERWYLTIDYSDVGGNTDRFIAGPFIIEGAG